MSKEQNEIRVDASNTCDKCGKEGNLKKVKLSEHDTYKLCQKCLSKSYRKKVIVG